MRNLALWLQVRDLAAEQRRLQASRGGPAVTRGPYSTAVQVSRRTPTAEAMTGGPVMRLLLGSWVIGRRRHPTLHLEWVSRVSGLPGRSWRAGAIAGTSGRNLHRR